MIDNQLVDSFVGFFEADFTGENYHREKICEVELREQRFQTAVEIGCNHQDNSLQA